MDILLGLASIAGLSLFLSRVTGRSASLMPLVSLSLCMLWFTLFGCVGLLLPAGYAWYALCLAATVFVLAKERAAIVKRLAPGWWLFVLGGLFLLAAFSVIKPMLTQWDEFVTWGTAARVTVYSNQLYTLAESNQLICTQPPGLMVLNYAMQFFGAAFVEYKFMVSLGFLYLAAFGAGAAVLQKHRAAAVLLLGCLVLLPAFFESLPAAGDISIAFRTCYADPSLAAVLGGALALYFGGGAKDKWLLFMLGIVLAALTNIKDVGLALAGLAAFIMVADLLVCERATASFYRLKKWKAVLVWAALLLAFVGGAYVLWAVHLSLAPQGVDRFDFGSGGESLGALSMLSAGVLALFGISRTEQFDAVQSLMLKALVSPEYSVSLIGPGVRVFAIILVLLAFCWLLGATRAARRRVLVFAITGTLGFVAYYIFITFTYSFIFSPVEALVLKDYDRYISPYWQGWLMGTLVLLGAAVAAKATGGKRARWRAEAARLTLAGVAVCFVGVVALRGNYNANALAVSPSLYTYRWDVENIVGTARAEGMGAEDTVYPLHQYDDGSYFYMLGYELDDTRIVPLFGGVEESADGGQVLLGNTASGLIPPGSGRTARYPVECTPELLTRYLRLQGCTGILLQAMDDAFYEQYRDMFADGLEGWLPDGTNAGGLIYYAVEWQGDACRFVPVKGGGAGG